MTSIPNHPRRRLGHRAAMVLAAIATFAALAACGDDSGVDAGDANGTGVTTTAAATTTVPVTEPAPDSTEAPTTAAPTTAPAPTEPPTTAGEDGDTACGTLAPIPAGAAVTSSVLIDWDGDGEQEAVATVYDTLAGNRDFRLRVTDGGDPTQGSEVALIVDDVVQPWALGPVQVDFSLGSEQPQPEELLVSLGANTSGLNIGVFFKNDAGCVDRFKAADDTELLIPIHASIGSGSGLACEGAAGSQFLVRTTAEAGAGSGEYDVHDIRLRRDGDRLVDDVDIPGSIVDDGSPTSAYLRYTSITNCGVIFPDD